MNRQKTVQAKPVVCEHLEQRQFLSASLATAAYASIANDAQGILHVAFQDASDTKLKYLTQDTGGNWSSPVIVDESPLAGAGLALALAPDGSPSIAYYDGTNQDLRFARLTSGTWTSAIVDAKGNVGINPSLTYDGNGRAVISYYDGTKKNLRLAQSNGAKWKLKTVESAGDVGRFSSVSTNPVKGTVAIAYEATDKRWIRFANGAKKSTLAKLQDATDFRSRPALGFDSAGNPAVAFADPANASLQFLRASTTGRKVAWTASMVTSGQGVGQDVKLHFNGTDPTIVYTTAAGALHTAIPGTSAWTSQLIGNSLFATAAFDSTSQTYLLLTDGDSLRIAPSLAAPASLTAVAVSTSRVELSWSVADSGVTGFRLERATLGGSFTTLTTVDDAVTSYVDLTVVEGADYIYRLYTLRGPTVSMWAATATVEMPSETPSNLAATTTGSGVQLSWQDRNTQETGFVVERSLNHTTWSTLTTLPANSTTYIDNAAASGNVYHYRVRGSGIGWVSEPSNVAASDVVPGVPTIFSHQWKENWNSARSTNHPWATLLIDNANASGTAGQRYSDQGEYGTYAFLLTRDVAYADKAWAIIETHLVPSTDLNYLRIIPKFALLYHGLKQGGYLDLHPDRRQQFADMLNTWSDATLDHAGFRYDDSDQVVAALGITSWALISRGENPEAERFLSDARLGGLNATSAQPTNVRNSIAEYCRRAAGGQWLEGTDYNMGTLVDLIEATEGIRAVTGKDYFPEVTAYFQEAAISEMALISPDMRASLQWGDNQWPRHLQNWHRVTILGMLAGVTQGTATGEIVQSFLRDYADTHGWRGGLESAEPWGRIYFTFNPVAPEADWRAHPAFAVPSGGVAVADNPGIGLTMIREGNGPNDTFAGLLNYNPPGVDHLLFNASDFQVYRNGEWVFTHPIGYQTAAVATNTTLVEGYGRVAEVTARIGYEVGAGGSYVYSAGSRGGTTVPENYFGPPTSFIQEMTRSMFYLPSGSVGVPVLILFDRMNVDAPSLTGYHYSTDRDQIDGSARKEVTFNAPVNPTVQTGGGSTALTWQTAGGQDVRVDLLSGDIQVDVVQATETVIGGYTHTSERTGYLARLTMATDQKWDTLASVVQVGDDLTAGMSNERVSSTGGEAQGVLVRRPGVNDVVVLFNARQGADLPPLQTINGNAMYNPELVNLLDAGRLHQSGFAVDVTTATAGTTVHLTDLDPAKQWTVRVDGAGAVALSVSAEGIGHLTLAGAGMHSFELVAAP